MQIGKKAILKIAKMCRSIFGKMPLIIPKCFCDAPIQDQQHRFNPFKILDSAAPPLVSESPLVNECLAFRSTPKTEIRHQ